MLRLNPASGSGEPRRNKKPNPRLVCVNQAGILYMCARRRTFLEGERPESAR